MNFSPTGSTNSFSDIPHLGAGFGFREAYRADLFLSRCAADFLEITVDHYFQAEPDKLRELDLLARHFTLIPHGLNLSLGSAEGIDSRYLDRFAVIVERVRPPYWSEHIAFTRAGGVEIGHLSPLPFTREAIDVLCRNIETARRRIPLPFVLENITYTAPLPGAEMNEAQFLRELLERTDCGLLLDITNLYINATNHGYDIDSFLDELPLERVVQLHFTGGHWHNGVLVDSHSEPTPEPVWELMELIAARAPVKGIILERDDNLPPFAELAAEMARAREIGRRYGRWGV